MSFYIYETTVEKETTAQRLVNHLDANAKEYYSSIVEKKGVVGMTETNAERLHVIKDLNEWANLYFSEESFSAMKVTLEKMFLGEHIDWLIEQAERAQELKISAKGTQIALNLETIFGQELEKENKRLREALEFYRNEPTPRPSYSGKENSTSVYKGVSWCPQSEKWRARLVHKGKTTNLGRYESEWEAAEVYNKKAQEFWGEEAFQNVRLASAKEGVSNDQTNKT